MSGCQEYQFLLSSDVEGLPDSSPTSFSALARSTVILLVGNIPCGSCPTDKLQAPLGGVVRESWLSSVTH